MLPHALRQRGTYSGTLLAQFITGLHIEIIDMFTDDNVNFVPVEDWFYSKPGKRVRPGFNHKMYKSPHFIVRVVMDRCVGSGVFVNPYALSALVQLIEWARPVHTVPHYEMMLSVRADVCGNAFGGGACAVSSVGSFESYSADGEIGKSFAQVWTEGTRFEMGVGRVGSEANGQDHVLVKDFPTGEDIDTVTTVEQIGSTVRLEAVVPRGRAALGISEAVLYHGASRDWFVDAVFPRIYKPAWMDLRIRWDIDGCCSLTYADAASTTCCEQLDVPETTG
jgi:hypothetical protein